MKLLVCLDCDDIFNLGYETKSCSCGAVKGKYIDKRNAIYSGINVITLAFDNDSFTEALREQPVDELLGKKFTAIVVSKNCETFTKVNNIYEI